MLVLFKNNGVLGQETCNLGHKKEAIVVFRESICKAELEVLHNGIKEVPVMIKITEGEHTAVIELTERQVEDLIGEMVEILGGVANIGS